MTDIVKGMVSAYNNAWTHIPEFDEIEVGQLKAMRAALLWLAANVSDEMVQAYRDARDRQPRDPWFPSIAESKALAAAIRAAAGGE